jgi:hypothetical protein
MSTVSETPYYSADHCFVKRWQVLIQRLPKFFCALAFLGQISTADQNQLISGQFEKA